MGGRIGAKKVERRAEIGHQIFELVDYRQRNESPRCLQTDRRGQCPTAWNRCGQRLPRRVTKGVPFVNGGRDVLRDLAWTCHESRRRLQLMASALRAQEE